MALEHSGAAGPPQAIATAIPPLLVDTEQGTHELSAGSAYRVGRDPQGHVVVGDPRVSWAHGELRVDGGGWIFADLGSTNGTFRGPQRVSRVELSGDRVLRLGHPDDGPTLTCTLLPAAPLPAAPSANSPDPMGSALTMRADRQDFMPGWRPPGGGPNPTSVIQLPVTTLRIGRAPDNDFVLDDLIVSRYHAELRAVPGGGYQIVDLGSHNGTFVNGARVASAAVSELDIVGVGHSTFRLIGGELRQFVDEGEVTVVAHDLMVMVRGTGRR